MKRLKQIIRNFPKTRIAVIGDMAADIYIYGKPYRLSREAPVIVVRHDYQRVIPGGAANTVNNLMQLDARVYPVGIVGDDAYGKEIAAYFSKHSDGTEGLLISPAIETITKTRIMAGDDHTSKQQVIRIDKDSHISISLEQETSILAYLSRLSSQLDALIVSDYGYGMITKKILGFIKSFARKKIVVVDSRYCIGDFKGSTILTPNQHEAEAFSGFEITDRKTLYLAAEKILKKIKSRSVLITQGNEGMTLFEKGKPAVSIPVFGRDDITDVTGAGDTVSSVIGLALGSGATLREAAQLSNYAAGVVVMKMGTATLTPQELLAAIDSGATKG